MSQVVRRGEGETKERKGGGGDSPGLKREREDGPAAGSRPRSLVTNMLLLHFFPSSGSADKKMK